MIHPTQRLHLTEAVRHLGPIHAKRALRAWDQNPSVGGWYDCPIACACGEPGDLDLKYIGDPRGRLRSEIASEALCIGQADIFQITWAWDAGPNSEPRRFLQAALQTEASLA